MTLRSHAIARGALAVALLACGGCAISAVAVAPSAGLSPVIESLGAGKSDTFWIARYDDVVKATMRTGETLSLTLQESEIGADRTDLRYTDDRERETKLRIDRQTETVTRARIDVGSRAFAGFARLLTRQITDELNDADAFVVDWSVDEDGNPG